MESFSFSLTPHSVDKHIAVREFVNFMVCDILSNNEQAEHLGDFSGTLSFLDDMGSLSDKSSEKLKIHSRSTRVIENICCTIIKLPVELDNQGNRRTGTNICK